MKVLWLSNCVLSDVECNGSGSWLYAMKEIIGGSIELYNMTLSNVNKVHFKESHNLKEYILPVWPLIDGLPSSENIHTICELVDKIAPDIIQVWGTESYWAKLCSTYFSDRRILLEMQGLLSSCVDVFWAGLSPEEIKKCRGIKEWIYPTSDLSNQYKSFYCRAKEEKELFSRFKQISTQSSWVRRQLAFLVQRDCKIYETFIPLREHFYHAKKWVKKEEHEDVRIFFSTSYTIPFKGLHVILKAIKEVKRKYPKVKLLLAGVSKKQERYRESGYNKYLLSIIESEGLHDNVFYLGKMNAEQIIEKLQDADVYVNSSFVESYSVATAEALFLGVPTVLSYAGALPEFGEDVALYYSSMDYVDCAYKIVELIENTKLREELSSNSIVKLEERLDKDSIRKCQLEIYNQVFNLNEKG